jgi:hypothetical protein
MAGVNDPWLTIAEDSGENGMGRVLAYMCYDTEEEANQYEGRRGELCDAMDLFIDEPIPDDFSVEVMQYSEFKQCYGNRMPLRNCCKHN